MVFKKRFSTKRRFRKRTTKKAPLAKRVAKVERAVREERPELCQAFYTNSSSSMTLNPIGAGTAYNLMFGPSIFQQISVGSAGTTQGQRLVQEVTVHSIDLFGQLMTITNPTAGPDLVTYRMLLVVADSQEASPVGSDYLPVTPSNLAPNGPVLIKTMRPYKWHLKWDSKPIVLANYSGTHCARTFNHHVRFPKGLKVRWQGPTSPTGPNQNVPFFVIYSDDPTAVTAHLAIWNCRVNYTMN